MSVEGRYYKLLVLFLDEFCTKDALLGASKNSL